MTDTQCRALRERVFQEVQAILRWQFCSLKNRVCAEDITQEVMIRLWQAQQNLCSLQFEDLVRLARRKMYETLVDLHRKYFGRRTSQSRPLELSGLAEAAESGAPSVPEEPPANEQERLVAWGEFHERVNELPENQRAAFQLIYYKELTHVEAARRLAINVRTVKRWYRDARRRLSHALEGWLTP